MFDYYWKEEEDIFRVLLLDLVQLPRACGRDLGVTLYRFVVISVSVLLSPSKRVVGVYSLWMWMWMHVIWYEELHQYNRSRFIHS